MDIDPQSHRPEGGDAGIGAECGASIETAGKVGQIDIVVSVVKREQSTEQPAFLSLIVDWRS